MSLRHSQAGGEQDKKEDLDALLQVRISGNALFPLHGSTYVKPLPSHAGAETHKIDCVQPYSRWRKLCERYAWQIVDRCDLNSPAASWRSRYRISQSQPSP